MRLPNLQCRETSECVMACTVSATRFSTPTLRINLATCALTVRSPMPSGVPISLLDRPSTSIFKTCVSRSVKATWSVGKIRRGELLMRSMNIESTRRGTQTSADHPYRLHEISRRCSRIHVALGPLSDGLENGLFVHAGASHDDPQVWTWRFQAGHHIEHVLAIAVAQKHQINVLLCNDVRR